jgi:hypothetical protein
MRLDLGALDLKIAYDVVLGENLRDFEIDLSGTPQVAAGVGQAMV